MKKRIDDSAEFKYFEEHYEEIMKEMDEDPTEYKMPEEWDARFRNVIEETVIKENKKAKIRKIAKIGSLTAAALLIAFISVPTVQGRNLKDIFQDVFDSANNAYVSYGTDPDVEFSNEDDNNEIFFDGDTLGQVNEQVRSELKTPVFQYADVFGEYEIMEARYDRAFHMITIELKVPEGYVYISQENMVGDEVTGLTMDADKCSTVNNKTLGTIDIYEDKDNGGYVFTVQYNQMSLTFWGNTSLDQTIQFAENIYYE